MTLQGKNSDRLLVVDDFSVMRQTIIRALEIGFQGSIEFVEAGDGAEALQLFQPSQFDLIISDWRMPNMDGLEFAKNVRSVDGDVPILMITTQDQKQSVLAALRAGVTDYLIKPFKQDMLLEKCDKYLRASIAQLTEIR
ncbi:MAG: response regulator [Pirellulales bacterium]|nr:response regulator [Pirellulales bacterium]